MEVGRCRRPRPRDRDPAVVAPGPDPARRPGRGGAAAGGLRHHPVRAPAGAARTRAHRHPAPPARRSPGHWPRRATSRCCRSRSSRPARGTRSGCPTDDPGAAPSRVLNPLDADRASWPPRCCPACSTPWCATVARGAARPGAATGWRRSCCRTRDAAAMPDPGVAGRPSDAEVAALIGCAARRSRCTSASCSPAPGARAAGGGRAGRRPGPTPSGRPAGRRTPPASSLPCAPPRRRAVAPGPVRAAAGRRLSRSGYAGELHPQVVDALGLPPRTCAMELDLDALPLPDDRPAPRGVAVPAGAAWTSRWWSTRRCRPPS